MIRVLVVCEADADRRTGCELAERVLVEQVSWTDGVLDTQLGWEGHEDGARFLPWRSVKDAYDRAGLPHHVPRGRGTAAPHHPDETGARKAILLARRLKLDAVLLLRDADKQPERLDGLEEARRAVSVPPCVIGLAIAKREAWVLNGYVPADESEIRGLEQARQERGFDPTARPERLDASSPGSKRDVKRVLALLTGDDLDRERACWHLTPLDVLRERGKGSGLTAYLEEIAERLAPLLGSERRA
jgi:hypothetical protein